MSSRPENDAPRMAFGCMAVMIVAIVAVGVLAVIFLWDVNGL